MRTVTLTASSYQLNKNLFNKGEKLIKGKNKIIMNSLLSIVPVLLFC